MVVFDITKSNIITQLQRLLVKIFSLEERNPDQIIMLFGNKSDLEKDRLISI